MQKWKVCKKLIAVILTLCMVLPLISNQYLVVRAEETGTGITDTKSISYTEVPILQIGENTITTDAQVVNYTDQSGEEAVWNGHVYQYTVPDEGSYVIGVTYMGDDENTYLTLKSYTLDADNRMQEQSNTAVAYYGTKTDVLSPILENGKTYYFKFSHGPHLYVPRELLLRAHFILRHIQHRHEPHVEDDVLHVYHLRLGVVCNLRGVGVERTQCGLAEIGLGAA